MRAGIWTALVFVGSALVLGEAHAWPAGPGGVIPIAQANESADTGDYFAVEGVVVKTSGKRFFTIRDESGEMLLLIPDYLTREKGMPERLERIRVSGKYDNKKLDTSVKGMRVSGMQRFGKVTGMKGQASPDSAELVPTRSSETPPASVHLSESQGTMMRPKASRDLVDRMADMRRAFEAAKKEVEQAAELYADALYAAGDDGKVDPAILDRLEAAEARMAEIARGIPPLVEEARAAGISDNLINLYKQSAGMTH